MKKITSRRNPLCIHAKKLGASRSYREEHDEFLCDGIKLLEEAAKSNALIGTIFTSIQIDFPLPENTCVYYTDKSLLESLSPLKNPQDILFTCKKPMYDSVNYSQGTHILLDNVQDPGNVGTIIRSADAFGIDSVILTDGSADPYNPKSIRASMGAIFRQRVYKPDINEIRQSGARIIGASADTGSSVISKVNLENTIIILGNEGQGISEKLYSLCSEMLTIPVTSSCESLNVAVAASVIMWEATGRERICD
jgi:TrmH family RNA methyltransferase